MKSDVNFNTFCDSFTGDHADNFTYEGKRALYDYLIEYEDDTGTELELDPIAFCCDFAEYESLEEIKSEYDSIESMEDLENNTMVIKIEGTDRLIIQQF